MMMTGFTIDVRRAGSTLAIAPAPANTSGAASHTHNAGELLPGTIPASNRHNNIDPSMPAAAPALRPGRDTNR